MFCTGSKIGKEIQDALGLKATRIIDIHLPFDDISTITVEYLPDEEDLERIIPILKKYKIVPIEEA